MYEVHVLRRSWTITVYVSGSLIYRIVHYQDQKHTKEVLLLEHIRRSNEWEAIYDDHHCSLKPGEINKSSNAKLEFKIMKMRKEKQSLRYSVFFFLSFFRGIRPNALQRYSIQSAFLSSQNFQESTGSRSLKLN